MADRPLQQAIEDAEQRAAEPIRALRAELDELRYRLAVEFHLPPALCREDVEEFRRLLHRYGDDRFDAGVRHAQAIATGGRIVSDGDAKLHQKVVAAYAAAWAHAALCEARTGDDENA